MTVKAFEACKEGLTSDLLLVCYDLNRELRLACNASSYGLGAVLTVPLKSKLPPSCETLITSCAMRFTSRATGIA